MNWHQLEIDEVFKHTGSSGEGLSAETAAEKLEKHGPNKLKEKKKKPAWRYFIDQFKDFMILVLIAAAIISGFLGDVTDTVIILIIVILNAVVGFVQEYRAEEAIESLKKMAALTTRVKRGGQVTTISSLELVPGDIVLLDAGTLIPADLRLVETHSIQIEESSLTGESVAQNKNKATLKEKELPLGDRLNMAYKGTQVTSGRGTGVVIATGMDTEIGHIAGMLQEKKSITPLQKRMADFGKKLSYIILFICLLLLIVGILRGEEPVKMLMVSISLAVAAIPEAMPALITIALARGAGRLVKKNVLIRKLPAVETLGSVTFICSDKTGTLTQNKMTVVEVIPHPAKTTMKHELSMLECAMAINHDVMKLPDGKWMGDPTEVAMVNYISKQYKQELLDELQELFPRVAELPFDSDRKCMTTIHRYRHQYMAISKGAVEYVVSNLEDDANNMEIIEHATKLAADGMRVLAYSFRILDELPGHITHTGIETRQLFAGLTGLIDPPREKVKEAIQECKSAGIHPVMITGDHRETAAAIARQVGILDKDSIVLSGNELTAMNGTELDEVVENVRVYARVSPEQKLNIVKALQHKNHFVAMTGDGVNDAPSLKKANIGIAMGITGTDVSKEAADMILLDDNFTTIVRAVKEGRRIYDNIRKFVKYIMTCNSAEIWTIFMAPMLGLPIPLLPIHLLWINLVTDGLPGLALSSEKAEHNIMKRPPRKTYESLFSGGTGYHIVWVGLLMAAITLGIQAWGIDTGRAHWQTMVFTVLSLAQLGHVFAVRSETESVFRKGLFSNLPLVGAIALTFFMQMAVVYLPVANEVFKTTPLPVNDLLVCIVASAVVFHAVELEKLVKRKFFKN